MESAVVVRRVLAGESNHAAKVMIASRLANVPAIPPPVHTDAEILEWFRTTVMPTSDVWLGIVDDTIAGILVQTPGWIEHLYVAPGWTSQGIGSALLDHAKVTSQGTLDLWTFVSNTAAQRFYERHGFLEITRTQGDNEEQSPDIRYRWSVE